jgi:protein-disulfide isomerase
MEKIMSRLMPWIAATATIAALILLPASASKAQESHEELDAIIKQYLATHPDVVGEIVKDYVITHPDVFRDTLADALKRQPAAAAGPVTDPNLKAAAGQGDAVKTNAGTLFRSAHQVTLGNPDGDVTLVEFFDYNCGFCKGALPAMLTLLNDDPKLKIVLKEWPILGPGSVEAADVAVAVRMQDPGGQKYLAFHRKLLGDPGPANKEKALAAAKAAGLDMTRLERDIASDEVRTTIEENVGLARVIGINGTPGYVIGDTVVAGAVGIAALKDQIGTARVHIN